MFLFQKKRSHRVLKGFGAVLLFFFFCSRVAHAQQAGMNTLTALDLSPYGKVAGLGFDWLALYSDDPTVGMGNPSLLTDAMSGSAVATVVPMFAGSNMGSVGYVRRFEKLGVLSFGLQFVNYGRFQRYDEEETGMGTFGAGDYGLTVGWGMWLDSNFSVGAQFKPVVSQYEDYTALAVAFDVAASYVAPDRALAATLMLRNIGSQIVTFDNTTEPIPFEISAEVSYKLKRAPFRLFFAATELQRWNLRYEDPLSPTVHTDPFTNEVTRQSWIAGMADNLLRHTQVGVEVSIGRSFFARLGYSYRQSAEMRGFDALNLSGLSYGIGLRTRRLEFAFARRNYHVSQAPNYFTIIYRF